MKTAREFYWAMACTLLCAWNVTGAELGLAAPEISIKEWVKGKPASLKEGKGKNIYVVEFWATWCPPCRASIPHLSELQKKFQDKNVVFIGVTDEQPSVVKPFVKKMGEKMDYAVAIDDSNKTSEGYMKAFEVNGIPHAFVVDKEGRVVWHGHPMGELETVLTELVTGKFDLATVKKVEAAAQLQSEYFKLVTSEEKNERAAELGKQILAGFDKTPGALNEFSWRILADQKIKHRDLGLAFQAAQRANELTGGKDPNVLDTYARALFDTGKHEEAIKHQKLAVELEKEERARLEFESRLNRYQRLMREARPH